MNAKLLDEERGKARKLESIGMLAGGIAHDFNNILTSILGNISMTKIQFNQNSEEFNNLDEAETSCYEARELIQQLMTFSRSGTPQKKNCTGW